MGQRDSRLARGAKTYHYSNTNDMDHSACPPAPKETIESLMRNLPTLIPLHPDEAILLEDTKAGRMYLSVSSEHAAVLLENLPQSQHERLKNAHNKAVQRLEHDSQTPVSCRPTPDRPYHTLLATLRDMLLRWKDMYRDGDGDVANRDKPHDPSSHPPPPYTFFPPQRNDDTMQHRPSDGTTRFAHTCSGTAPKKPMLKSPSSASHRALGTVACSTSRPSLIPRVDDQDKVSGGRHTATTESVRLFESKLQIRFSDVSNIMKAHRHSDPTHHPLESLAMTRLFDERRPELGFLVTTPKIVKGDLHLWTKCRISARTTNDLHEILAASRPDVWLRPCRHLGASTYHRMPLRDDNLGCREFMAHAQRHGGFAAAATSDQNHDTRQNKDTRISCQYCYTDCDTRMWKHEFKDTMSSKTITTYCLDIDVWHNLGAGFDAMETKWLGFAAAASFTTLKVVPIERGLGSVAKAYQYEESKAYQY